jgi:hypothetical protein
MYSLIKKHKNTIHIGKGIIALSLLFIVLFFIKLYFYAPSSGTLLDQIFIFINKMIPETILFYVFVVPIAVVFLMPTMWIIETIPFLHSNNSVILFYEDIALTIIYLSFLFYLSKKIRTLIISKQYSQKNKKQLRLKEKQRNK